MFCGGDKAQISSGEGKRREGVRGVMGENPKLRCLFEKFPSLRYKLYCTNCCSDKLPIITIAIAMPQNLDVGISSDFKQFLLVKNNFV